MTRWVITSLLDWCFVRNERRCHWLIRLGRITLKFGLKQIIQGIHQSTTYPSANRVVTKQSQSSNRTKINCKRTLHSVNINLGLWNLDGVRPCHELESLLQYFGTLSSNVMTHWQSPTVRWMPSILRVDLCSDDSSCGTTGCKTHLRPQVFGSWRSKATIKLKTLLSTIPPRTLASDNTTEDGS